MRLSVLLEDTALASAIAAAALVVMPTRASAQLNAELQTGSRIPVKPHNVKAEFAGVMVKNMGECMFSYAKPAALKLLANSDSQGFDYAAADTSSAKLIKKFNMVECLGDQAQGMQGRLGLRFPVTRVRSMLLEESYLKENRVAPKLPAAATEAIDRRYVSTGLPLEKARGVGTFADCVVFRDTPRADAILRTMPRSAEERSAARALAPSLGACLAKDQVLAFTPSSIRAFMADGLWTRYVRPASLAQASQ